MIVGVLTTCHYFVRNTTIPGVITCRLNYASSLVLRFYKFYFNIIQCYSK